MRWESILHDSMNILWLSEQESGSLLSIKSEIDNWFLQ